MAKEQPPEERLLQHIRKKGIAADTQAPGMRVRPGGLVVFRPAGEADTKALFRFFDRLFLLVCGLSVLLIAYQLFFVKKDARDFLSQVQAAAPEETFEKVVFPEARPFDYYAARVRDRDIFQSPLHRPPERPGAQTGPTDGAQGLRLVGIVLDDSAEAVIEDTQANRTFFVRVGDSIQQGVVEKITEDKVVITFGGQQVELRQ